MIHGGCHKCKNLKHNFGPTMNSLEWDWLFFLQGGKCAAEGCNRPAEHLDHCHDTGTIRELLCIGHNTSLGLLGEDVIMMIGLIRYKLKHT
tara:strand:+ start:259 stop:531 length:273 start_codon:yes stop_codon:yes gene_type:complete